MGHWKRSVSMYQFLDQSAWSICELIRKYYNEWSKSFISDKEFVSRFKSKDMKQHYSAEMELLLYTILKKQGYEMEKHPDLGGPKRPDFRVSNKGFSAIVECTLAGDSFDSLSDRNLKATIEEIIDEIEYHPYCINITFSQLSKRSISKKRLLIFLEEISKKSDGIPNEILVDINHSFEDNGWQLEFSMLRKPEPLQKRSLGNIMNHAKTIYTSKPLLTSLNDKKPSRYGDITQPYIICVNTSDLFTSEECFSETLFGQYAKDFIYTSRVFPDGLFLNKEKHNTSISAVLFIRNLNSYTLDFCEASLWHNPYAKFPVPMNVLPFNELSFNEQEDRLDVHIDIREKRIIDLLELDKDEYLRCKSERPLDG
jgi:hypothetical protein